MAAIASVAMARDDSDRSAVQKLIDGGKVDLATVESVIGRMDALYRRNEHKTVYKAYGKIRDVALTTGEKIGDVTDVPELVRRYHLAGLMRKFAMTYGQTVLAETFRQQQDLVVARYSAVGNGVLTCPENSIAAKARALSGWDSIPERPRPVVAIIPRPAELKELSGVLTLCGVEATERMAVCTEDRSLPEEGYALRITDGGIEIRSSSAAGRFYAIQTLKQLACANDDETLTFPCIEIRDAPRFGWRGVMLDEARHFFGKGVVKRMLDEMAYYKFNVFHWHLTDNQGWRFPVLKRPDVAKRCSTRKCSTNHCNEWDTFEDRDYGPYYYTEKDIREIVAYAAARHIRIVPEIDVPGHSEAVLGGHPEMSCSGKGGLVFCVGNPETQRFLDDVFDSVVELFPGGDVHIGCDEVDKTGWKKCPKCQSFMREHGMKEADDLQMWIISHVSERLAKAGRRVVGWDDIAFDGDIPKGAVIMEWQDEKRSHGGVLAVKRGHPCVMTPWATSYFIGPQKIGEEFVHYGGPQWYGPALSLEEAYAYDPLAEIPDESRHLVLGGQCCNWTESTANEAELQWKMWPRAFATAEIYWTPAARRDFMDFRRRVAVHRPRQIGRHVNCAPIN